MSKFGVAAIGFIGGAVAGGIIGYIFACQKTRADAEKYINEEVEAMKKHYKDKACEKTKCSECQESDEKPADEPKKPSRINYASAPVDEANDILSENDYICHELEIIPPEQYDTDDEYEPISLTYYADGVVCTEDGAIFEDHEEFIGDDFYKHFGEYEDDSVYIRNNRRKVDYEILKDVRKYHDIFK